MHSDEPFPTSAVFCSRRRAAARDCIERSTDRQKRCETVAHGPGPKSYNFIAVLSPEDVAQIRAEIERLEEARTRFSDSGILKQIDIWIADEKKKLADIVSRNAA
jgi:hypothetical protein